MEQFPHIIVIHVRKGYEDRAAHIEAMMQGLGVPFEYLLDGDISDLSTGILETYFAPEFRGFDALRSCSYKHLLACETIIRNNWPGAIIMEDDAELFRNFKEIAERAVTELGELPAAPAIISFEDTRLRFVPRSEREKGKVIYRGDRDRLAGCYFINNAGARAVVDYAASRKLDRPIDNFHALMLREGRLDYYWTHPTAATQGSFTGLFPSSLTKRYGKLLTPFVWQFKLNYRKLLYWFR